MVPRRRSLLLLAVLAAIWMLGPQMAEARHQTPPDLFYNYYVPPDQTGGAGAALYVSPRPVPATVGHTWVTYQPLMPHEFLYTHDRMYVRRNPGAGITVTKVCYGHCPLRAMLPPWMDGKILTHIFINPFAGYGQYYNP
jgi:hypothetical protein